MSKVNIAKIAKDVGIYSENLIGIAYVKPRMGENRFGGESAPMCMMN